MRTTIAVFSLILVALLACGGAPASAADDLTWDSVRTAHLLVEAMHCDFAEVAEQLKAGKPWHVIAGEAGVVKTQLDRIARQHREHPQPQR